MNVLIPLLVAVPLLAAVLFNFLHGRNSLVKYLIIAAGIFLLAAPFIVETGHHYFSGHLKYGGYTLGIEYWLQPTQKLLLAVFLWLAALVLISALSEFQDKIFSGVYFYLLMMIVAATAAVLMVNDVFNLYVFLEISAIVGAGLVISLGTADSLKTALKYLLMGCIAGNFLLLGITMLLGLSGNLNISDMQEIFSKNRELLNSKVGLFGLTMLVFGMTYASGLVPFNTIKSSLYSSTMPHAAALLQSQGKIMLAAFALILFRIYGLKESLLVVLLLLGTVAMVFGVIMALNQRNYLNVLAYVSVSQAGLIAVGFGLGTYQSIQAALFHTVNDILYMSALFIGAGLILYKAKTLDFDSLGGGGLLQKMPYAGLLTFIGILSASAVPPTNGFQSELRLILSSINAGYPELGIIIILAGVATFIALARAYYTIFLSGFKPAAVQHGSPLGTILALTLLIAACMVIGLFPQVILKHITDFLA